ncbi:MAG TPA: glucokinase [Burkholderiales bacterium]|nr:glucokinase [Burkholderiales bacterium]
MNALYLAADIGGTNSRVAVAERIDGRWQIRARGRYPSQHYPSAEAMFHEFLGTWSGPAPLAAGVAVAGPVIEGRTRLTNVSWEVNASTLATALGNLPLALINDFEAVGRGVDSLAPEDLVTLQPGVPHPNAPRLLVGAGTGLGVSILVPTPASAIALPSEGGHGDFAPEGELEIALMRHLVDVHGHASWERVVSGLGLEATYAFVHSHEGHAPGSLTAAEITHAALDGSDPWAVRTLDIFVSAYGRFTGNIALAVLPRGGIYIAGGIAPRIVPKLREGAFLHGVTAKGRFTGLMAEMPVHLVTNDDVGMFGALNAAAAL